MGRFLRCVLLLLAAVLRDAGSRGYCEFPEWLWRDAKGERSRTWLANTKYIRNTASWERRRDVDVQETEILVYEKTHVPCPEVSYGGAESSCFKRHLLRRLVCISAEPNGKFRIMEGSASQPVFTCMRFQSLNKNALLVFSAESQTVNEEHLCWEESLKREEWPWIAPKAIEWSPCPFQGGFDFRIFIDHHRKLCESVWRSSRLEVDCVRGEGVDFFFPEETCSPFYHKRTHHAFHCWASWSEDDVGFVLLAETGSSPQFVLRYSNALFAGGDRVWASLFFSPVATSQRALRSGTSDVRTVNLWLGRSDADACHDESAACPELARRGKCTSSADLPAHCKKSCNLCSVSRDRKFRGECHFPAEVQRNWMLFQSDQRQAVAFHADRLTFSSLGTAYCKAKHWRRQQFKLVTLSSNGCRPRYSCIVLQQEVENMLHFRLSRSRLDDEGFSLCQFADDAAPLGGRFRSKLFKLLLAQSSLTWGTCHLSGSVRVKVTSASGGTTCPAVLSDWNEGGCAARSSLTLTPRRCTGMKKQEFLCVALASLDDVYSMLITQEDVNKQAFMCWVVRSSSRTGGWEMAVRMSTKQCGSLQRDYRRTDVFDLKIASLSGRVEAPCSEQTDEAWSFDRRAHSTQPTIAAASVVLNTSNGVHRDPSSGVYRHPSNDVRRPSTDVEGGSYVPVFGGGSSGGLAENRIKPKEPSPQVTDSAAAAVTTSRFSRSPWIPLALCCSVYAHADP